MQWLIDLLGIKNSMEFLRLGTMAVVVITIFIWYQGYTALAKADNNSAQAKALHNYLMFCIALVCIMGTLELGKTYLEKLHEFNSKPRELSIDLIPANIKDDNLMPIIKINGDILQPTTKTRDLIVYQSAIKSTAKLQFDLHRNESTWLSILHPQVLEKQAKAKSDPKSLQGMESGI